MPNLANSPVILRVQNLSKYYYDKRFFAKRNMAIDKISFEVRKGEIFGITGNNSCGKSTIASIISGAIRPNSGTMYFNDQQLQYGDITFRREHIRLSSLEQIDKFNLNIDVSEFFDITLEIVGIDPEFRAELITLTLKSVNASPTLLLKDLSRLNRQEKAIVSLAHALILHPDILIIDDLFATIDLSFKGVLINIILELQKQGITVLLITSDLGIIKHLCDRVMILQDGVIEDMGDCYEVLNNSSSEFTHRLVKSYFDHNLGKDDWQFSTEPERPTKSRAFDATFGKDDSSFL